MLEIFAGALIMAIGAVLGYCMAYAKKDDDGAQ